MERTLSRASGESGSRQKFLYCPLLSKSTKAHQIVSVSAMENLVGVTMDSGATVCYMKFSLCARARTGFAVLEEQRLAF
jgi:hypothetical protein